MARIPKNVALSAWINQLIKEDKIWLFYKSDDWLELREDVLRECHNECQLCLEDGIYKRAEMVHHVNEVRKRPDLALTKRFVNEVTNEEVVNLIALCNACHERVHDRAGTSRKQNGKCGFKNEERW